MSKFCQYCGAPLQEGQVCGCPQAQAAAAAQQQTSQPQQFQAAPQQYQQQYQQQQQQGAYAPTSPVPSRPSPVGAAFKNLLPFLKAYFHSPVGATRNALRQGDVILSIILLVIQVIAAGLVMFSGMNSSVHMGSPNLSVSFPMCLLYGILAAIIGIALFVTLIFAAVKIVKSTCSYKDALTACGCHSLLVTILLLVAFVLFFASFKVGCAVFGMAMLVWIIMGVTTAQELSPEREKGAFWFSLIAAVLVTSLVGGYLTYKLAVESAKTMTYKESGRGFSYSDFF